MNKEEFAEKLSKLCTYKNGHFTSELIGLEKATKVSDILEEFIYEGNPEGPQYQSWENLYKYRYNLERKDKENG